MTPTSLSRPFATTLFLALGAIPLFALTACQGFGGSSAAPDRAQLVNEIVDTAEVVAVEPEVRNVRLRRSDGSVVDVTAGSQVQNFDQIDVGDTLRVRFSEALMATKLAESTGAEPARAMLVGGVAELGAKPAVGTGLAFGVRVKIESVDLKRDIVVYSTATGELLAQRVVTPEGRAFAKGLRVGDTVQLDYTESLALSIEEL
jgi:hypothetical protein